MTKKKKSLETQGRERAIKLQGLTDFFEEAKAYAGAKRAAAAGKAPAPQVVPAWEAMIPYATGERPVMKVARDGTHCGQPTRPMECCASEMPQKKRIEIKSASEIVRINHRMEFVLPFASIAT